MWTLSLLACSPNEPGPPSEPVVLRVDYGSEKKVWMEDAVARFEAGGPHLADGRPIRVTARALGSGEAVADIVEGRSQPAVFSPASSAYLSLLDEQWLSVAGHTHKLTDKAEPVVLSPVVLAMWRPMAEALGWPDHPVRWADLLAIAKDPEGWASRGHPEWGRFKLGHTHPALSNSGLLSILSETYAALGKTRGLAAADLPAAEAFVGSVESSLVHYGKSTGFMFDKMLERGPSYVSAVVSYENLVIDSYRETHPVGMPVVAVYPEEGTFWSDHPWAVLDAEWVHPEEREAAKVLEAFLRTREIQDAAMTYGFRPADPTLAIAAPIDAAHGVDPTQPKTLLEVPDAPTLRAVLALWERTKKSSDVFLVFDKSGSMRGEPLVQAKRGAREFLHQLGDRDQVSLQFFDTRVPAPDPPVQLGAGGRDKLGATVDAAVAGGGTALYDAVQIAFSTARLQANEQPNKIHAVVVMTDGKDEGSKTSLKDVLGLLRADDEAPVKVFTIAYGAGADPEVLQKIAEAAKGAEINGRTEDISAVFQDMAAFF